MAQRSSIDRLPADVRGQVDQLIARRATIDEVVGLLLDLHETGRLDQVPSRSAVGRYAQRYSELAERQREVASIAKSFAGDFGTEGDLQGRLMAQLVMSLVTRVAMAESEGEEPKLAFKDLQALARAAKDAASAAKIDTDREAKIRTEAAAQATRKAAEDGAAAAKAAGATAETVERVRRGILGIGA